MGGGIVDPEAHLVEGGGIQWAGAGVSAEGVPFTGRVGDAQGRLAAVEDGCGQGNGSLVVFVEVFAGFEILRQYLACGWGCCSAGAEGTPSADDFNTNSTNCVFAVALKTSRCPVVPLAGVGIAWLITALLYTGYPPTNAQPVAIESGLAAPETFS